MYQNIILQIEQHIAQITINRPDKLNALNIATIEELHQCFSSLAENKEVRCVIITGSGTKSFVAGADISEFAYFSSEEGKKLSATGHEKLFTFVENFKKPVIAAVNGFALGGGLELAMSCHFRIASENAKLGLPEVSLGVIPGYGGTQRLVQLIGKGKAFELIFSAGMLSAADALKWGLVNDVVAQDELIAKCKTIAEKIVSNSPSAISFAIEAVNEGVVDTHKGFEKEIELFGKCFNTQDFKEGTSAFLEKRKPIFKGN